MSGRDSQPTALPNEKRLDERSGAPCCWIWRDSHHYPRVAFSKPDRIHPSVEYALVPSQSLGGEPGEQSDYPQQTAGRKSARQIDAEVLISSNLRMPEERLRNTRAWAAARVGSLSGAEVIVSAIDELLQMREDWKTICEAAEAMPSQGETPAEPRCACGAYEWGPNTTRITDSHNQAHYREKCASQVKTSCDAPEGT